jgi:orotate phosphoribosyltransferase
MDCRRLISFPAIRRELTVHALSVLYERQIAQALQSVAGGEASGIAVACWLAEGLDLPMQYVRKKAIGHMHIEGVVTPGSRVLLVDDLMAAGHSKLSFLRALQDADAVVEDALVLFDYGTFGASRLLASHGVTTHALTSWVDVLHVARQRASLGAASLDELQAFLDDPGSWSERHGGIAEPARHS